MRNIIKQLEERFQQAFLSAYPQLGENSAFQVEVVPSSNEKFGDYQCNTPMKLAKELRLPPRQIAEAVTKQLEAKPIIRNLEVAGPGFINIFLDSEWMAARVEEMIRSPHLGIDPPVKQQRVIVEFSSPNVAKELHVGHLRSTIIGDCLARIFEFLGEDVLRLNHIGDWGTAFGMLIAYLQEEHPDVLSGAQKTDLAQLVEWYKKSKARFDEDITFKKRSQLQVVALQSGDPDALKAWEMICEISRKAYGEIYELLDIRLTERGESYYNPILPGLVKDLEKRGQIEISDGAKCIFLSEFKNREGTAMPLMVQKSDGGFGYDSTDMAAMKQRVEEEKAERIIIVTDAGQSLHFQLIHAASIRAGYLDPKKVRFDHVPFGLVLGPDGKKFRTRSGDTERLVDLLYTAVEKADAMMCERNPSMPEAERKAISRALGIGAVKYADLSCHRTGDYSFSYDRMLRFDGNTAAFLMYAYVRIAGIKRKLGGDLPADGSIQLHHPSEMALGMHLLRFIETLEHVAEELLPNRLTEYLYGLAERFNAFYRDCQVEGSKEKTSRLLLCETTAQVLKCGLHLLGVETVEKM